MSYLDVFLGCFLFLFLAILLRLISGAGSCRHDVHIHDYFLKWNIQTANMFMVEEAMPPKSSNLCSNDWVWDMGWQYILMLTLIIFLQGFSGCLWMLVVPQLFC